MVRPVQRTLVVLWNNRKLISIPGRSLGGLRLDLSSGALFGNIVVVLSLNPCVSWIFIRKYIENILYARLTIVNTHLFMGQVSE